MTIRVLIVDDQALVRGGFRVLIDAAPDMTVIAEAGDGATGVALTREHRPDVVLMDVRMPELDGIEASRQIISSSHSRNTRILMLTTFDLDEYVFAALRAGASGFLLKDTSPEELLNAIRVIAAGEALLAPKVTRHVIEEFARQPEHRPHSPELDIITEREQEVLVEIARGLSNTEIAVALSMSPATAKTHVSRLLAKLNARDRAQLVIVAYETGLVTPG
ncbi:MAG TPA: response regulator transcription factor [Acidimicrobiia bacterium]